METYANPYSVAAVGASERALFIRKTYMHVALAVLGFIAVSAMFWRMPAVMQLSAGVLGKPLIVLGAFMGVSWLANSLAFSRTSRAMQYFGLALYTVFFAFMIVPIMYMAHNAPQFAGDNILMKSAGMTIALFLGLTAVAVTTKKDFSFLGSILKIGFFLAIGLIVAGSLFGGFTLGLWFSFGMVALLSGSILYTTSNILRSCSTDMYVGAALALFSSIATMFWYILQIFMRLSND